MSIYDRHTARADIAWSDEWPGDERAGEDWAGEDWADEDWPEEEQVSDDAVTGLRLVLSDDYADVSDAEMADALEDVMNAMSAAEAFNFGAALNQIARGAGQVLADPNVASIARTALPIAGGALGTVLGGPIGTALGGQLGTIAANALPAGRPVPRPVVARTVTAGVAVPGAPVPFVPGAGSLGPAASAVAGGSAAAAQGLVLAGHPLMQQALASAAFGQHGQQQVGGIPVAQLLGLLGRVVGQAAAEADELLYLSGGSGENGGGEGDSEEERSADAVQNLYTSLIDAEAFALADTLDLAESLP